MFNLIGEALLIAARMDRSFERSRHRHDAAPQGHETPRDAHGHTPRDTAPNRGLSNRANEVRK